MAAKTARLRIQRGTGDATPHYDAFDVPFEEGATVLDALKNSGFGQLIDPGIAAEKTVQVGGIATEITAAQARLVEDLLDVSRVVTGNIRLDLHLVDLRSVIEAALETVRRRPRPRRSTSGASSRRRRRRCWARPIACSRSSGTS